MGQEHGYGRGHERRLPAGTGGRRRQPRRRRPPRTGGRSGAELGSRPRRSRPRRVPRAGALRAGSLVVGRRQRLLADGSEPRPHDLGVRRGDADPVACRRGTRHRDDRPERHRRRDRRDGRVVEPGARARRGRLRPRGRRRDRTPAGRQPGHPSRADDDPRGAAARVRRPRPGLPAVGGRGAPLARARARRRGVPPSPAERVAAAGDPARWRSSCCAPRWRSPRRSSPRCAFCSSPDCSPPVRWSRCSGSPRTWRGSRERRARLGARRSRSGRRRRAAALCRGRAAHRPGARPGGRRGRRGRQRQRPRGSDRAGCARGRDSRRCSSSS